MHKFNFTTINYLLYGTDLKLSFLPKCQLTYESESNCDSLLVDCRGEVSTKHNLSASVCISEMKSECGMLDCYLNQFHIKLVACTLSNNRKNSTLDLKRAGKNIFHHVLYPM
jgi:hypothetical protein